MSPQITVRASRRFPRPAHLAAVAALLAAVPGFAQPSSDVAAPDPALVQKLLQRIEQLEARDAARADQSELVRQLQNRISELESKITGLQTNPVLPEIVVAPSPGPSVDELDQQVRILQRQQELAREAAEQRAKDLPVISIGPDGFNFRSADSQYALRLRGLLQTDTRTFFDDHPLSRDNDGFFIRRARPIFEGTLFEDLNFVLAPEFASSTPQILDAYVNYRFRPELEARVGRFRGPVGFENILPERANLFNERSFVTGLVPLRSQGIQLHGKVRDEALEYAVGVFNANGDTRNPSNEGFGSDLEFAGRLHVRPFKTTPKPWLAGLGIGVGGSYSQISSNAAMLPSTTGGSRPGYVTSAQQQFFAYNPAAGPTVADGAHWRVAPHLEYLKGPFGVIAEYALSNQGVLNATTLREASLAHDAWQVTAQWVLTGEDASFTGIQPLRPFGREGGWGAWQLVARYGQFDIDDEAFQGFSNPATSATSAISWSVGVNWWLNRNMRVLTSFQHTSFDGGGQVSLSDPQSQSAPATVTHQDEQALLTRLQIAF